MVLLSAAACYLSLSLSIGCLTWLVMMAQTMPGLDDPDKYPVGLLATIASSTVKAVPTIEMLNLSYVLNESPTGI